jgi:hypothetical protein
MQYILLYRGQKFFFTMWGIWVSKDADLNVDFKNINLYKRQNAPKKSKSRIKILFTTQGAKIAQIRNSCEQTLTLMIQ